MGLILLALLGHRHSGQPQHAGAAPADVAATPGTSTKATTALRHVPTRPVPIVLPPPLGDAPRAQPLLTEWVIDSALLGNRAFMAAIREEAPLVVSYLRRYGLRADRLGFGLSAPGLFIRADQGLLAHEIADPKDLATLRPATAITLPVAPMRTDRAIVVITANPRAWLAVLPSGQVPPAPRAGRHPSQARFYVISVASGSGAQSYAAFHNNGEPRELVVDPRIRGELARALARVFVDATGVLWS